METDGFILSMGKSTIPWIMNIYREVGTNGFLMSGLDGDSRKRSIYREVATNGFLLSGLEGYSREKEYL